MTPFYEKALSLFTRTQKNQIEKGLKKYPKAFEPSDWTPEELLNHALEETVDLTHYIVGLKELLDAKDKEIQKYKNRCSDYERKLNTRLEYVGHLPKKERIKSPYDMNFNPHFDQDDQH
jgi:hypothetical protein